MDKFYEMHSAGATEPQKMAYIANDCIDAPYVLAMLDGYRDGAWTSLNVWTRPPTFRVYNDIYQEAFRRARMHGKPFLILEPKACAVPPKDCAHCGQTSLLRIHNVLWR